MSNFPNYNRHFKHHLPPDANFSHRNPKRPRYSRHFSGNERGFNDAKEVFVEDSSKPRETSASGHVRPENDDGYSSTLLAFKAFLQRQPDDITDTEAQAKYKFYKETFEKKKIEEFFEKHYNEEWFQNLYHPGKLEESWKFTSQSRKNRLKIFWDYLETNSMDNNCLDHLHQNEIMGMMDVITKKLEQADSGATTSTVPGKAAENEAANSEPELQICSADNNNTLNQNCILNPDVINNNCQVIKDCKSETKEDIHAAKLLVGDILNELLEVVTDEFRSFIYMNDKNGKDVSPVPSTMSIHLKRVPVSMTRLELESIMLKYPGFLRLSLSDPNIATDFETRKAWVTFSQDTKVKEVCISLGEDLGPVINKELSKKIRLNSCVISAHEPVVRNDIKIASQLITCLDNKWGLFNIGGAILLTNVQDYLVQESSAEEDELLGVVSESEEQDSKIKINKAMIEYLDKLILYLRIVHSFDFYNGVEYNHEDLMPHKFGMIHVRGPDSIDLIKYEQVLGHNKSQSELMKGFLEKPILTDVELAALGRKYEEAEVEKFIQDNIVEVAKERFLCPLSGKKFKGPDYVRKHILSRFNDRVENVRMFTQFFNNYLRDPKRPKLKIKTNTSAPSKTPSNSRISINDSLTYERAMGQQRFPPNYNHPLQRQEYRHFRRPYMTDNRPRIDYNDMELFQSPK